MYKGQVLIYAIFVRLASQASHLAHPRCSCLISVVFSLSRTRMRMMTRAQSSTLAHLAAQTCGRGSWSPKSANRRQSRPPLGCSAQERQKQRAKISPYVPALLPHRNGNHLSIITVAAAPHRPHCLVLRTTDPSDHTATAPHAVVVFFFTLAFDCSSFPWNTI